MKKNKLRLYLFDYFAFTNPQIFCKLNVSILLLLNVTLIITITHHKISFYKIFLLGIIIRTFKIIPFSSTFRSMLI